MRILRIMAATASALLMLSAAAFAQQANCNNPQTQTDMNICAGESLRAADGDLNADYKMARDEMRLLDSYLDGDNKGAAKALLTAQRTWIKYRDAACEAEGFTVRGGSMEPMIIATCLERLTRQRSEDLRRLFERN
jgi:uncharacterized protein YecT (DUF1311 family)